MNYEEIQIALFDGNAEFKNNFLEQLKKDMVESNICLKDGHTIQLKIAKEKNDYDAKAFQAADLAQKVQDKKFGSMLNQDAV